MDIPLHRIVGIAGVSGAGKTTMVLESLIPALETSVNGENLPEHIRSVSADKANPQPGCAFPARLKPSTVILDCLPNDRFITDARKYTAHMG